MADCLVTRTIIGGKDLYYGCPDLTGAVVESVESIEQLDDYRTDINLRLKTGELLKVMVLQER